MHRTRSDSARRSLAAIALGVALVAPAVLLGGCRGDRTDKPPRQFFPDMDDQPRWKPQGESQFFADSRTMRQPVPGTVAFGVWDGVSDEAWAETYNTRRADFLRDDEGVYEGRDAEGNWLQNIPVPVTRELLETGRKNFNIYCSVCHGYTGEGATGYSDDPVNSPSTGGMAGRRWSYPVPGYHDPKYFPGGEKGQDGYIFHVARVGVIDATGAQKMPGYAHAIDEHEAWGVVAYVRALQEARHGRFEDAPDNVKSILRAQRGVGGSADAQGGQP